MIRTNNFTLVILLVIFISASCAGDNEQFEWKEGKVVISGKLVNLERHPYRTINFRFADLLTRERIYTAEIEEDGSFRTHARVLYPQDFTTDFGYGYLTTHIACPGDSLYFEIDPTASRRGSGQCCITVVGGTSAQSNIEINRYLSEQSDAGLLTNNTIAVRDKSPNEYLDYINKREEAHRHFLKHFNEKYKTSDLFQTWAEDQVRFESLHHLLNYRWRRRSELELPGDYFSFLDNYNMENRNVVSHIHADFLHELSLYSTRFPTGLRVFADSAVEAGDFITAGRTFQEMIKLNSSGFTRDVLLSKLAAGLLHEFPAGIFETLYDSTEITDSYLREGIEIEYFRARESEAVNIYEIDAQPTVELIRKTDTLFRGKVVYIDFWGPWCRPCLEEIPSSKKIQELFKGREVAFLNFAFDTNERNWKAAISKYDITGEHFLLNKDQFNVFYSLFGIDSAPRYVLVDPEGNVVLFDAPRPSETDNLISAIEKLLDESSSKEKL